jgi:hypothetical protein
MKIKQYLLSLSCIILVGISFLVFATCDPSISSCASGTALPACTGGGCFPTAAAKHAYEVSHNCTFATGTCHLANGEDIFRWAIGKRESGVFGYSAPDVNHCDTGNKYCAAQTGNPASAGRPNYYAASYGTHHITTNLLIDWLNPNGSTLFHPPPDCLKHDFLDDPVMMVALQQAVARRNWGASLVNSVPTAIMNPNDSFTIPAIPLDIRQQAINLGVIRLNDPASEVEFNEMWRRMTTWKLIKTTIINHWGSTHPTPAARTAAWGALSVDDKFRKLVESISMRNDGHIYDGIKPYIISRQWPEAVIGFSNNALFAGAAALYTKMMSFFDKSNNDCHIAAVKQMFKLTSYGYDGNHDNPIDSFTESWVKKAACAWNSGSPSLTCPYATVDSNGQTSVWTNYKYYYNHHYGVTEVCN